MGWIETYALGGLLLRGTVPMQQVFMLAGALTMCLMALYLAGISCRGGWDIRARVFCEVFPAVVFPVATESLGPLRSSTAIHARLGKRRQDSARVRDQAARPESAKPGSDRDSFPDQPVTAFRIKGARLICSHNIREIRSGTPSRWMRLRRGMRAYYQIIRA